MAKLQSVTFFRTPEQPPYIHVCYGVHGSCNLPSFTFGGQSYTLGDTLTKAQFDALVASNPTFDILLEQ